MSSDANRVAIPLVGQGRLGQALRVSASARRPPQHPKPCACTGVRWCASCRDPRVRVAHGMDPPLMLPEFLRAPLPPTLARHRTGARVFELDPDGQAVPGCAEFGGVHLLRDFVSDREASRLLEEIERRPFLRAQSGKQKQHFGAKVNFNKRKVNAAAFTGLPAYAGWIERRVRQRLEALGPAASRKACDPALTKAFEAYRTMDVYVLRYRSEQQSNLDFHVDDCFAYGELILDLSLESDGTMTFLRERGAAGGVGGWDCVRVPLPARSLAILYGSARFHWQHAILAFDVQGQRTSITLRTLSEALRGTEQGRQVERLARRTLPAVGSGLRRDPV